MENIYILVLGVDGISVVVVPGLPVVGPAELTEDKAQTEVMVSSMLLSIKGLSGSVGILLFIVS